MAATSGSGSSPTSRKLRRQAKALGKQLMPKSAGGKRAMAIGLGLAAVLALTVGLLAEQLLWHLASAMSALGAAAVRRAQFLQEQREEERRANRPPPATPRPPPPDGPEEPGTRPPPSSGPVKCTKTGKPIEVCGCSTRHVATAEGAEWYGRPVGSPIGRRTGNQRKPHTTKPGGG